MLQPHLLAKPTDSQSDLQSGSYYCGVALLIIKAWTLLLDWMGAQSSHNGCYLHPLWGFCVLRDDRIIRGWNDGCNGSSLVCSFSPCSETVQRLILSTTYSLCSLYGGLCFTREPTWDMSPLEIWGDLLALWKDCDDHQSLLFVHVWAAKMLVVNFSFITLGLYQSIGIATL